MSDYRTQLVTVVAVTVLGIASGCGNGHPTRLGGTPGPPMYRGESHGVQMTIRLSMSPPGSTDAGMTLVLHFGRRSDAVRQRALRAKHLQLSCFWPTGPLGSAGNGIEIRLSPTKRTEDFETSASRSSGGFACALSSHAPGTASWPATRFLRQAIVAVHLVRTPR